jgi:gliding motility-associated-like protein
VGEGEYTLMLSDEAGCEANETFNISQPDSIEINLISFIYENGFNLSDFQSGDGEISSTVDGGTMPYTYNWNTGQTIPDITELSAGIYTLTITDSQNCISMGTIVLTEPEGLTIPTGYTPNEDGFNDFYVIQGLEQFDNVELFVFNRWGNEVYTNSNYDNTWNGLNNSDDELADGTYYVIVKAIKDNETIELNSFVDLRR